MSRLITRTRKVKKRLSYFLTKDGFTLLAIGYTGPEALRFKLAYISEFNRMDAEFKRSFGTDIDIELVCL
ncbi:MAG: Rha family transcriptional regulator [Methylococcales bacterium]